MNAYYFCNPEVSETMCAVASGDQYILKMVSIYEPNIHNKVYLENSRMFYIINGRKHYITVNSVPTSNLGESMKYSLKLTTEKEEDNQLESNNQIWQIQNNSAKFGYHMFFPTRTFRTQKKYEFLAKGSNSGSTERFQSTVRIFYNNKTKLIQTICFDATKIFSDNSPRLFTEFETQNCLFLMDNREFKISSKADKTKFLVETNNIPGIGDLKTCRIEPIPGSRWIFSNRFFLIFPNTTIGNNENSDRKLFIDSNNSISINTAEPAPLNCQWEFLYIPDTNSCLIKNVSTGWFLSLNSEKNGLTMEASFDLSDPTINTTKMLRMCWDISSELTLSLIK